MWKQKIGGQISLVVGYRAGRTTVSPSVSRGNSHWIRGT